MKVKLQNKDKKIPDFSGKKFINSRLVNSWAEFLDKRDWDLFTTLTTQRTLSLEGARRSISKLHLLLKQNGFPAEIFFVCEPYDVKEGQHVHALINFADLERRDDNRRHLTAVVDSWRQVVADRKARVYSELYKRYQIKKLPDGSEEVTGGANFYLGKYLQKYKSDSDFFLPFSNQNKNLEFDHSNMFRPEMKMNFKNRKEFTAWKYKMIMQAKDLKAEVKAGEFYARDNSVYSGSALHIKNLDYQFLEASMIKDQFNEKYPAIVTKAQGAFVQYEIKKKDIRKYIDSEVDLVPDFIPDKKQTQSDLRAKVMQARKQKISLGVQLALN